MKTMLTIFTECVELVRDPDNNTVELFVGTKSLQNAKNSAKFPICFADPFTSTGPFRKTGVVDDVYTVNILIAYKSKLKDSYSTLAEAIANSRYVVDRIISKLSRHESVMEIVGDVTKDDALHVFDLEISGCTASFQVRLKKTQKIC